MERRKFLKALGIAGAGLAAGGAAVSRQQEAPQPRLRWTAYSRHLQWLTTRDFAAANPFETGVAIGEKAQEIGFSHVDLTVRRDGHVDPERVDLRINLPRLLEGLRSTGATCTEITTDVTGTDRPAGEIGGSLSTGDFLALAADHGIRYYKWGRFGYDTSPDPVTGRPRPFGDEVTSQLDVIAAEIESMAALNRRHGVTGLYHTYSGRTGLRSVWDLVYVHRLADPADVGFNFDIGHMTREGALSAWSSNLRYAMPWVRGVSMKDATVERGDDGRVRGSFVRAGTGLVQWEPFFRLLLEGGFSGPAEAQYEYEITGARGEAVSLNRNYWADDEQFESGNLTDAVMTAELKKDLAHYRESARAAGWQSGQLA